MAEFDSTQIGYSLHINGEYHNTLDIEGFSQMMKDPSYCYKFYWLEAIVDIISEGTQDTTFDAIIDEMICNAWYSVREFHIHLSGMQADGLVRDGLERAVLKLKKEVHFNSDWMKMIQDNTVNILGWIQYEKVKWLQNNNPEVPSLIYKLAPMDEKMRKLNNVRKLWEGILDVREVRDVFTGNPIVSKQYDVDHFIPWSFVMNDELWNLMPMDSSLNSSKSNKLPKWDPFFIVFAENQFGMYKLIHEKEELHKRFEACYRDNLHSIWAGQELYRPGNTKEEFYNILQKNMQPVYDSARRQGYEIWNYQLL